MSHKHGALFHARTRLAMALMPRCARDDINEAMTAAVIANATRRLMRALHEGDTAAEDQERALLRDQGAEVHVVKLGEDNE